VASASSPRVLWVDYAKGISITLVVLYHVWAGIERRSDLIPVPEGLYGTLNPVFEALRMPLFFFISGMFAIRTIRREWRDFIVDKLRAIMWPYLIWSTIQSMISWGLARVSGQPPPFLLIDLPVLIALDPLDQFWFLYVLFLALLLFYFLSKVVRSPLLILGIGFLMLIALSNFDFSVVGLGAGEDRLSLSQWGPFFQVLQFFMYMALGAICGKPLMDNVVNISNRTISWIGIFAALVVVGFIHGLHIERDTTAIFLGLKWPVGLPVALLAVASCLCVAVLLDRLKIGRVLLLFGKYSLYLFVLHVICAAAMRFLLLKLGILEFYTHLLLGCGAGLLIPILVAKVARKLNLLWLFTLPSRSRGG